MRDTKDFGRLFFQPIELLPWSTPVRRGDTQEINPPFRTARSFVLHLPGSSAGIVVGWWRDTGFDANAAADAVDIIVGLRSAEEFTTDDMADWVKEAPVVQELTKGKRVVY